MIPKPLSEKRIILASQSPRRQYLLKELGFTFDVMIPDVEEAYPPDLSPVEIAVFLAELKADNFDRRLLDDNAILITADTIVFIGNEVLGKPESHDGAIAMLKKLSGRRHEVITAVCLLSKTDRHTFHVVSDVIFKDLSEDEIRYYVENFRPFDKAGAYGIQEWIGYIGIDRIEGSFFNVMGLPVKELYEELLRFSASPTGIYS